ncbi:hypothetical protein [Thaumasiovibrio subtropicus]|uniref:hypothetical protein n=1 Tax=Thaumasiovibrio subtropicus TaxID=1891207 RepID=UPI000B3622CA|nr:hypothetical protein [Thaumasiovibrio subtropicus]
MKDQKAIALDAIELVKPAIERLFESTNRQELHIVVMNPQLKPWESTFEDAILVEQSIGSPEKWTIAFDQLARKKAHQAWRHQQANLMQQSVHPASLREGDVLFYGSFVYGDIVVACSGVQQWFDMLISSWIATAIEQLTVHEYQTNKLENPTQQYR